MSSDQINSPTSVSMLVPFRARTGHLAALRSALDSELANASSAFTIEVIVVEADRRPTVSIHRDIPPNWNYTFVETEGAFHKTQLLNTGLELSCSEFVVPYDVDLIPAPGVLARHIDIAARSHGFGVVTGYRLMSQMEQIRSRRDFAEAWAGATIAPEDQPTALAKYLRLPRKFGILPFFRSDVLRHIGGWDERFVGWGVEDEEVLGRYLAAGFHLLRCPQLVYLHQHHAKESQWSESDYVNSNRTYYDQLLRGDVIDGSLR